MLNKRMRLLLLDEVRKMSEMRRGAIRSGICRWMDSKATTGK